MSLPDHEQCWQAVVSSDSTYDGQFVFAVRTTGIYCRPSCSSRLPKRDNVRFFALAAAAEAHGFRACKRCQPQQIMQPDAQAARVALVCDHIDQNLDAPLTLDDLSTAIHWSPFHLQRTFKQVMGITPRQYTEARRMAQFKQRLKAGDSVLDAALDAGYSSSNRVYKRADQHLGMTPTTYRKGGDDVTIAYSIGTSPLGRLLLAMTERGVCAVEMGEDDAALVARLQEEFPAALILHDDEYVQAAMETVLAYLEGWSPHLDLPLDIRVTAFQQRVLDELQRIPYGETRTYGEIAALIGSPKAARAVGNACNKNPVPLLIPCHRVVGKNGSLTGYAFGLARKRALLKLESDQRDRES